METKEGDLEEIKKTGKFKTPAKIQYSRPYDYLQVVNDRKEIMAFFMLISCFQSSTLTKK